MGFFTDGISIHVCSVYKFISNFALEMNVSLFRTKTTTVALLE